MAQQQAALELSEPVLSEKAAQALAQKAAGERDARYRAMLPHERFCLPGQGQVLPRVERFKAYREVDGGAVPMFVTRCMECAASLVTPFDKETM